MGGFLQKIAPKMGVFLQEIAPKMCQKIYPTILAPKLKNTLPG